MLQPSVTSAVEEQLFINLSNTFTYIHYLGNTFSFRWTQVLRQQKQWVSPSSHPLVGVSGRCTICLSFQLSGTRTHVLQTNVCTARLYLQVYLQTCHLLITCGDP